MYRTLHVIVLSTCFLALLGLTSPLAAQAPSLSGTVATTSGGSLSQATVELLEPNTDQVMHHGYVDSHGRYALWNVPAGRYDLRVKFGARVLTQVIENGEARRVQRREVRLGSEPLRLIVRIEG